MRLPFTAGAAPSATTGPHAVLASLLSSVGTAGLAAAAATPGLLAAVDQHAAAVRDSLDGDVWPVTRVGLAGYAEGVRDAAREHGWQPPAVPVDWSAVDDWVLLRLLAVCLLAEQLPPGR
ncbi:DUF6401 family natural product biosynthesis protein [Micromonospora echinofusca]|uniref:Uncharacterized protein n=1 Tax=Micromonospora echinofusca TaxID=47858 RepID=A0ABS3VZK9_MICEH|nr:DUF6401 family natural product biosynthesis protein [Micromonospora echinofusca]MBO4209985.1 hypothetical protein [Micromonospora echinofusca]